MSAYAQNMHILGGTNAIIDCILSRDLVSEWWEDGWLDDNVCMRFKNLIQPLIPSDKM